MCNIIIVDVDHAIATAMVGRGAKLTLHYVGQWSRLVPTYWNAMERSDRDLKR